MPGPFKAHSVEYSAKSDGVDLFRAELRGFEEVPAIFTSASGSAEVRINEDEGVIEYRLSYDDLSSPSTAAHIHFGQPGVNGGIMAFLCGGDDKPECPLEGGTVSGTITAENILAIPEQGLQAGDFHAALVIIRAGLAYVNVHSQRFPAGEIRGQLR